MVFCAKRRRCLEYVSIVITIIQFFEFDTKIKASKHEPFSTGFDGLYQVLSGTVFQTLCCRYALSQRRLWDCFLLFKIQFFTF